MTTPNPIPRIDEFSWLMEMPVVSIELDEPERLPLPDVVEPVFSAADEILNDRKAIYIID